MEQVNTKQPVIIPPVIIPPVIIPPVILTENGKMEAARKEYYAQELWKFGISDEYYTSVQ